MNLYKGIEVVVHEEGPFTGTVKFHPVDSDLSFATDPVPWVATIWYVGPLGGATAIGYSYYRSYRRARRQAIRTAKKFQSHSLRLWRV